MEDKLYMGIDVGGKGFISMQHLGHWEHYSIESLDLYELSEIMAKARATYTNITCVIEDVHAIFGASAKSTFNFGFNKGYLVGLLAANKIPYTLVAPKEWQKVMWSNNDMVIKYKTVVRKGKEVSQKEVNTKQTSINASKRMFPTLDLRKSERATLIDDNKVDSILMCEYGRRMNL